MDFLGNIWAPIATVLAAYILIDQAYIRIKERLHPATSLPERVKRLEEGLDKYEKEQEDIEHINKLQCKAMLDIMMHMRDGNHVANMNNTIHEIEDILVEI